MTNSPIKQAMINVSAPITLGLLIALVGLLATREMLIVSGRIPSRRVMHGLVIVAVPTAIAFLAMVLLRFVFLTVVR